MVAEEERKGETGDRISHCHFCGGGGNSVFFSKEGGGAMLCSNRGGKLAIGLLGTDFPLEKENKNRTSSSSFSAAAAATTK